MYIPKPFKEERIEVLHDAIRRAGLATLVSMTADGLVASHVPLLLDSEPAPYGTLLGHLARPNAQARGAIGEALAIFLGPDSYITPSWYATKRETGKVVPTWNYVAIHAYGPVEFIDDPDHARNHITELTRRFEQDRPTPWAPSDAPEEFIEALLRGIIGFRLTIRRLEGKWKMVASQYRNVMPPDLHRRLCEVALPGEEPEDITFAAGARALRARYNDIMKQRRTKAEAPEARWMPLRTHSPEP